MTCRVTLVENKTKTRLQGRDVDVLVFVELCFYFLLWLACQLAQLSVCSTHKVLTYPQTASTNSSYLSHVLFASLYTLLRNQYEMGHFKTLLGECVHNHHRLSCPKSSVRPGRTRMTSSRKSRRNDVGFIYPSYVLLVLRYSYVFISFYQKQLFVILFQNWIFYNAVEITK